MKKYSELRNLKRQSLEELIPLKFPLSLYIETTNRCNFRCRYCPLSLSDYVKISGGFATMSLDNFKKICHDIKMGGVLKVLRFYFMGEPLLNPNLFEMINMACRMKLAERTELTSNGALLDEKKSQALINSGLDYLRISISSVDQCRHQHLTQTNVQVSDIYNKIKYFKQLQTIKKRKKPFLCIKMIDSLSNDENLKFLQMYRSIGDEVVIEKPMNWDGYKGQDLLLDTYRGKQLPNATELYPYPKSVCPFPFYTLLISVNGDITVCCVDWNKATRVGNVFESTLSSVWNGEEIRKLRCMHVLRKRALNPSCANCQFLFTSPDNLDNMPASKIEGCINGNDG